MRCSLASLSRTGAASASPLAPASSKKDDGFLNKFNKMPRSGAASSTQFVEAAPGEFRGDVWSLLFPPSPVSEVDYAAPDWGSGGTGFEVDSAESDILAPSTSSESSYGCLSTPTYEAAPAASPTYEAAPAASSSSTTDPPVPAPRLTNKQRRLASYRVMPQNLVDAEMAQQAYEAGVRAVRGMRNWR